MGDVCEPAKPGRPRDPACDAAITAATVDAFVRGGYGGVSIEGVAARAGVGKATIYRRFSSKAELVVEAVRARAGLHGGLPATGDLRQDLGTILRAMLERLRGPDGEVLITLLSERQRHPELAAEFERSVMGAKRAHARRLVADAVERGELPADTDVELLTESGPALIWHHALFGLPLTDDLPDRILDFVLASPGPSRRPSPIPARAGGGPKAGRTR